MATGMAAVAAAALGAGAVGAGAVLLLYGGPSAPLPAPAGGDGAVAALEQRVARQEEEIRGLRSLLEEALAGRPHPPGPREPAPPGGPGAPPPGPGEETADGDSREPADAAAPDEPGPGAARREPDADRRNRAEEAERTLRARLERSTAPAFTPAQVDAVMKSLSGQRERLSALFLEARTAGTDEAFREAQARAVEIRAETRRSLEGVLDAEQLKVLEEGGSRPGRFGGRAGLRGGPGAGGGGRRAGAGSEDGAAPPPPR